MGWLAHLIVDAALALGLLIAGVHGKGADYYVLDGAGAYLAVAAIVTAGRGRTRRRRPRLVHRLLDGVLAVLLFASPFLVHLAQAGLDVFATAMAEVIGLILLRDALVTREPPPAFSRAGAIEAQAREAGPAPAGGRQGSVARRLGRGAAGVRAEVPAGARRAGKAAGRLSRLMR